MTHHSAELPTAPAKVRDPRSALLAGGIVAGVLLVQNLVAQFTGFFWGSAPNLALMFLLDVVSWIIPFGVGVFVALLLWPVRSRDRWVLVLLKGLVATLAGALAAIVGGLLVGVFIISREPRALIDLVNLLPMLVARAPLVMLVVLVQWVTRRGARL
jgi:hypothetical protein